MVMVSTQEVTEKVGDPHLTEHSLSTTQSSHPR